MNYERSLLEDQVKHFYLCYEWNVIYLQKL